MNKPLVIDPNTERSDAAAQIWGLTPTQSLVLQEVVKGLSNKEIGLELGMAEATVEVHMTQVFRRSGIQGRGALISRFWTGRW